MSDFFEIQWIEPYLQKLDCEYAIAGGWALDIFLHKKTRSHQDLEIMIWREDQSKLKALAPNAQWEYIQNHTAHNWPEDKILSLPIHEIHCQLENGKKLEILLNEKNKTNWIYRRNPNIKLSLNKAILNGDPYPILAPEIVLLYKSKDIRPKDKLDFNEAWGALNKDQKNWFIESLKQEYGDHEWSQIKTELRPFASSR